jgi:AraC-like DNA-binding protein
VDKTRRVTPTLASKHPRYLGVTDLRPAVHLAGYYHFKRDVRFQYRIPSHHLMLIESGRIEAQTEESAFDAASGDLICFRPAEWNQYETHSPTSFYQVHVEFAGPPRHRLTPFLRDIGPLPVCLSLEGSFADARTLFETICLEITHAGVVHQLRIVAAVYELLAIAAGAIAPVPETVRHLDPWLRMQQRLDSALTKELKIDELARQMGLSNEHFIRQFKHHFGMSPKAYHTRARLQEAARALRGSDKPIKAVAYDLGFGDPKSFTRRFRHHLGVKPSDLRPSAPPGTTDAPGAGNKIFPMNVHLLPPQASPLCFDRYLPRKKRTAPALDERGAMADKLRHPEKYV